VTQHNYVIPNGRQDFKQLSHLLLQAFVAPLGVESSYIRDLGLENFRVLKQDGQIVAGLVLIQMAQWFGGRSVPMTGIASVAVAPEYRGTGCALDLLRHALTEIQTQGIALSVLYPATQRLYRQVGYEQGGHYCGWEMATTDLPLQKPLLSLEPIALDQRFQRHPLSLEPISSSQISQGNGLKPLYQQQAQRQNGALDRSDGVWKIVLAQSSSDTLFAYYLGTKAKPQGYLLFRQDRKPQGSILEIGDWVILTPEALQSFWAFLANHRSQIDRIYWRSAAIDPLTLTLPEQKAKSRFCDRWMLRLVDLVKALEMRGYPSHCTGELHLAVEDPLLSVNTGRLVLAVAQGQVQVSPGGQGDLQVKIQDLVPLYTGLFSAQELQVAGKLTGSEAAIDFASQLFAGSSPWMPDFF
jgi:predicted acetyltransferase